jgi:hypothetical protein
MKSFDLYGFKDRTLEQVKSVVEQAVGVQFVSHESSFWGEYYKCGGLACETIKIHHNYDTENECIEESFKGFDVLLYVDKTDRGDALREALTSPSVSAVLLRHEEY